jgi:hypothetical protein
MVMVRGDPITMVMVTHGDPRPDDPGDMGNRENAGDRSDDPVTL